MDVSGLLGVSAFDRFPSTIDVEGVTTALSNYCLGYFDQNLLKKTLAGKWIVSRFSLGPTSAHRGLQVVDSFLESFTLYTHTYIR